jgi:hypothetical protein
MTIGYPYMVRLIILRIKSTILWILLYQVLDGLLPSYLLPDSSLTNYTTDILISVEKSRGKKFENKFVSWFTRELELGIVRQR